MKTLKYIFASVLFGVLFNIQISDTLAQNNKTLLVGRVIDSISNSPVHHVSVRNLTTGQVSVTDENGDFRFIDDPISNVGFEFSLLGYNRKIVHRQTIKKTRTVMLVPRNTLLEEVVVSTGYQMKPKERVTGSFEVVGRNKIDRRIHQNVLDQLNGRVASIQFEAPSVRPDYTPNLNIRGRNTIYSNDQPLYVVDNMAYDGDISLINSNDIESITVLKDASAASIWGARAGNGVIVIRTKTGNKEMAPTVSFTSTLGWSPKPDLDRLKRISSTDFIDFETFLFDKGYYENQENNPYPQAFTPVVEMLIQKRDGLLDAGTFQERVDRLRNINVRDEFKKYFYRTGIVKQNGINIVGAGNRIRYFLSVNYDHNQEDKVKKSNTRFSIRSNNSYQICKNLEIGANIVFSQRDRMNIYPTTANDFAGYSLGLGRSLYPYAEFASAGGDYLTLPRDLRSGFKRQAMDKGLLDWNFSPLKDLYESKSSNDLREADYVFNPSITYRPTAGVVLIANYQFQKLDGNERLLMDKDSYETRNLINHYAQVGNEGAVSFPLPIGDILKTEDSEQKSQQGRLQINIEKSFAKEHNIDAMAGIEIRENRINGNSNTIYGYSKRGLIAMPVDYITRFKFYDSPMNGNIPSGIAMTSTNMRFFSYFSNLAYTYKGRYSLSGSARVDQSNLFGVKTNNRKVPLWSIGGLWHVHKEDFMRDGLFDKLSLRSTFGYSGNIGNAVGMTTITYSTAYLTNLLRADVKNPPNESLRWEKNRVFNLGLDFALFKNRLYGSVEYYNKLNTDLLSSSDIDPTTGLGTLSGKSTFIGNVATTTGDGIDITLNSVNAKNKDFSWESSLVFSVNHSKVKAYYSQSPSAKSYINSNSSVTPLIGYPVFTVFSYEWAGLDASNGTPLGFLDGSISNEYGKIMNAPVNSLQYHGPAQATIFGGVSNTLRFKNLSLSFNLNYRFGSYFRRSSISYDRLASNWEGHADYAERWQKPGDEKRTDVPALVYPFNSEATSFYLGSAALIEKADFISLHDVFLDYTLPHAALTKYGVKSIVLKGYLSNLGYLWLANSKGTDPFYGEYVRPQKSFNLGISLTF